MVKASKPKGKPEPMSNNYFTLFLEQEKYINGQMAATKNKFNHFTILSNSKLCSFKFDHILKTTSPYLAMGETDEPSGYEQYVDLEVNRFIQQNK